MEHKRKKQWILIIMLLLTVCSVFVVYAGREWMFTNPFKPYTFSSVSYASGDGDGCTYVIDDSNRKILKISADGRLLWRACASDKSFLSAERVVMGMCIFMMSVLSREFRLPVKESSNCHQRENIYQRLLL